MANTEKEIEALRAENRVLQGRKANSFCNGDLSDMPGQSAENGYFDPIEKRVIPFHSVPKSYTPDLVGPVSTPKNAKGSKEPAAAT